MMLTVLAAVAFVAIGIVLIYCVGGDTLGLVDLDKIFGTRLSLFVTLFVLGMVEWALWDFLFA